MRYSTSLFDRKWTISIMDFNVSPLFFKAFVCICLITVTSCSSGGGQGASSSTPPSTPTSSPANLPVGAITDLDSSENQVLKTAAIGDGVGIQVNAIDPDSEKVSYHLSGADPVFFSISDAGIVTLAKTLSNTMKEVVSITVTATSADGTIAESTFDITVVDKPTLRVFLKDSDISDNRVTTAAVVGDTVGVIVQAEGLQGEDVNYYLAGSISGAFAIDSDTGVVTVAGALSGGLYTINVSGMTATSEYLKTFSIIVDQAIGRLQVDFPPAGLFESTQNQAQIAVSGRVDKNTVESVEVIVGGVMTPAIINASGVWRADSVVLNKGLQKISVTAKSNDGDTFEVVEVNVIDPIFIAPTLLSKVDDASQVFLFDDIRQAIFSVDIPSGDRVILAEQPSIVGMVYAAEADGLYLSRGDSNDLILLKPEMKTQSPVVITPANLLNEPLGLAINDQTLYVASSRNSQIVEINIVTGEAKAVLKDERVLGVQRPQDLCIMQHADALLGEYKVAYVATQRRSIYGVYLDNNKESKGNIFLVSNNLEGGNGRGVGPKFRELSAIECAPQEGHVIVTDRGKKEILVVDLDTGNREVLAGVSGVNAVLSQPEALVALDSHSLLVVDSSHSSLIRVDRQTGVAALYPPDNSSTLTRVGAGVNLVAPKGLALDSSDYSNPVLYSFDVSVSALLEINLNENGNRRILSEDSASQTLGLGAGVQDIQVYAQGDFGLISQVPGSTGIPFVKVDLASGERSEFVSNYPNLPSNGNPAPAGMALDIFNHRVLVVDPVLNGVFSLDLTDGTTATLSRNAGSESVGEGVALTRARSLVFVGSDIFVLGNDIIKIDETAGGDRSLYLAGRNYNFKAMALEPMGNRLLLADQKSQSLLVVDLNSREVTPLSSKLRGRGIPLLDPINLAIDNIGRRVFTVDKALKSIVAIDLVSGDRIIISR